MSHVTRLMRVRLSYADGMVLHTASSGAVPALDELRLVTWQDGEVTAMGATRLNIAYLSGIDPDALCAICAAAFDTVDPRGLPADLPAPARMLFEMAAADGAARAAGMPLAAWLGGPTAFRLQTNQTLFWSDDTTLLRRAHAYVARGFDDLKLRVGAGGIGDDLRRIGLLRDAFGTSVKLSADANGSWTEAAAPAILDALAALGLSSIEQPIPAGDWNAIARVSAGSAIPVMLDESLGSMADVDTLLATRAAPLAHLKLAKLGGLDRLMQAGRALQAAGIPIMVGQMNEGSVSTLAAAHAAAALGAAYRELYGADGLQDDPAGALRYAEGCVDLPPGPGLGLARHATTGILLRERIA
jgi:L-alanine-DL-glutamate epimerase-like enolase superfamily enzyme